MTFQHPGVLTLLPLSLLPVIFHLLGQRLRREVPFPWIRLLSSTEQEGRYRRQLLEWLILLLRVLALAFPILALAGPRWGRTLPIQTIAVDVSHSMNAYSSTLPRIIQDLQRTNPDVPIRYFADRWVPRYRLTDLGTDYRPLNDLSGNVLVVTDLQKSGFRIVPKPQGTLYILPVGKPAHNVAITEVRPASPLYLRGIPVRVEVTVTNYSDTLQKRVLVLQGQEEQRKNIQIPARSRITETFQILPTEEGALWVELLPHDAIPGDDRRVVAFSPIPKTRVALVGAPQAALTSLLAPQHTSTPFEIVSFSKSPSPKDLESFDLIVWIHQRPHRLQAFLTYFQSLGKALVFFDTTSTGTPSRVPQTLHIHGISVRAIDLSGVEGQVILRSDEGIPVAIRKGQTLWLGFSPDPRSDWILSGDFVVFFYRVLMKILNAPLHYAQVDVGKPVTLPLGPQQGIPKVWLGKQEIASQWTAEGTLTFVPMQAGLYRIVSSFDQKPLAWVAAWVPVSESDPTQVTQQDLESWLGPAVHWVNFEEVIPKRRLPNPVILFLTLAIGMLALEALLLRRISPS